MYSRVQLESITGIGLAEIKPDEFPISTVQISLEERRRR
jgi:hypothetical protein